MMAAGGLPFLMEVRQGASRNLREDLRRGKLCHSQDLTLSAMRWSGSLGLSLIDLLRSPFNHPNNLRSVAAINRSIETAGEVIASH
jgi:hypothetical protein